MIELLIWLITLLARHEPDLDGPNCFEDEAVVVVVQTWDENGTNRHLASPMTGAIMCAPVDDMRNGTNR